MTYRFNGYRRHLVRKRSHGRTPGARWFNERILPRVFPEARGRAWLLHNVEEVGNLEHFLPTLIAQLRGEPQA